MLTTLFQYTSQIAISTIEWVDLMRGVRDGKWREIVEVCRKESLGSDELRRRLPAFGASVTFLDGDEAANVVKYNHIVALDFDKVLHSGTALHAKIEECREKCRAVGSVVGFYITKGGRGFRVFVSVNTGLEDHKRIYHPLQEYFERLFGLQANDRYKDLTRLSFVSYDPDCFFRKVEEVEPFDIYAVYPNLLTSCSVTASKGNIQRVVDYLTAKYEIRYNVLKRVMQCRLRHCSLSVGIDGEHWIDVDDRLTDALVRDINDNCVHVTYNQFQWMADNHHAFLDYNELDDFISRLPGWDGIDHIAAFRRGINITGGRFYEFFALWMSDMYRAWFVAKPNRRVMALYSDLSGTGKTSWIIDLVPQALRPYVNVSSLNFLMQGCTCQPQWLLIVIEDFCGGSWLEVERIMKSNPKASVAITSHRYLPDAPSYVHQFRVGVKKGGSLPATARSECMFAQLKHFSGF